jgi:hemerythrin
MPSSQGWTPDLLTGVEAIDQQHREVFRIMDDLMQAMRYEYSSYEVNRTVRFLADYVIEHFHAEEKLMREHNYPKLQLHNRIHNGFMAKLLDLHNEIIHEGGSKARALKVQRLICGTLVQDIETYDKDLAVFLNGKPMAIKAPANKPPAAKSSGFLRRVRDRRRIAGGQSSGLA